MENITSIVSLIRADCRTRADCRLMDKGHIFFSRCENIHFSFLVFNSSAQPSLRQQDSVTIGSLGN